jgi:hypothetical protein
LGCCIRIRCDSTAPDNNYYAYKTRSAPQPFNEACDQVAGHGSDQTRHTEGQEHPSGGGVATGQVLRPDPEGQVQGAAAETRDRVSDQQPPEATIPEHTHRLRVVELGQRVADSKETHRARTLRSLRRVGEAIPVGEHHLPEPLAQLGQFFVGQPGSRTGP